jgi:hypothetical protein
MLQQIYNYRHPDKNEDPSAGEKFMKISEAYKVVLSAVLSVQLMLKFMQMIKQVSELFHGPETFFYIVWVALNSSDITIIVIIFIIIKCC